MQTQNTTLGWNDLITTLSLREVSVFGVFWLSLRIQSKCGKIRTRNTPNKDNFHAVYSGIFFNPFQANVPFLCLLKTKIFFCWLFLQKSSSQIFVRVSNTPLQLTLFWCCCCLALNVIWWTFIVFFFKEFNIFACSKLWMHLSPNTIFSILYFSVWRLNSQFCGQF